MKDCRESIKEGYADIVGIMKLEQAASKLKAWLAQKEWKNQQLYQKQKNFQPKLIANYKRVGGTQKTLKGR